MAVIAVAVVMVVIAIAMMVVMAVRALAMMVLAVSGVRMGVVQA